MDLRQLRVFATIAEEMNFTRAAVRLRVAQPSLTMQIKRLEQEVGFALFDRSNRAIALTPAGAAFLGTVREMLQLFETGADRARKIAAGRAGGLTVAYIMAAEYRVFRKVIPSFRQLYPDIRLTFRLLFGEQQLRALRNMEVDVAFTWLPVIGDEFVVEPLLEEELLVCLPRAHPLAELEALDFRHLHNEPMITFIRETDPITFGQLQYQFAEANAVMNVVQEMDHPLSALSSVAMGYGCCIVPSYQALQNNSEGIVFKPFAGLKKTIAIVRLREDNPVVDMFVEHVVNAMTER